MRDSDRIRQLAEKRPRPAAFFDPFAGRKTWPITVALLTPRTVATVAICGDLRIPRQLLEASISESSIDLGLRPRAAAAACHNEAQQHERAACRLGNVHRKAVRAAIP